MCVSRWLYYIGLAWIFEQILDGLAKTKTVLKFTVDAFLHHADPPASFPPAGWFLIQSELVLHQLAGAPCNLAHGCCPSVIGVLRRYHSSSWNWWHLNSKLQMQASKSHAYSTPPLKQNREEYIIIIINWCLSVNSRWLFGCWCFILQNRLFLKIEAEMKQSGKWHQRDAKQKLSYQGSHFKALCGNADTQESFMCVLQWHLHLK